MADFFDTTEAELKTADDLEFNDKEIVKFQLRDFFSDRQTGNLKLNCQVQSGPHTGKDFKLFLSGKDNDASKKRKSSFLHAFWTSQEINAKQCNPAKLMGRFFTAKASVQIRETDKKRFQNFSEFQDLGPGTGAPQQVNQAPQQNYQQPQQPPAQAQPVNPSNNVNF